MPHSPLDIYAQYRFLEPSIFGTNYVQFRARYAICDTMFPGRVLQWINRDELSQKFHSIAYTCKSEDVLDLPPTMHERIEVELCPKARRVYDELDRELVVQLERGTVTVANALVKLLRLQQLTSGYLCSEDLDPREELDTSKRDALEDILDAAGPDEPVVVFCRFRPDLAAARAVAEKLGRTYHEVSGSAKELTSTAEMLPDTRVLGVQIQSGGVGIDLTRSCYAVYYSMGFSLGDYLQSLARLNRPGQTRPVRYYHLVAKNSVDVRVYAALRSRKQVIDSVVEGMQSEN